MRILAVAVALMMVLVSSEGWIPNIKWRNPSDPNVRKNKNDDFLGLEDVLAKQTHRKPKTSPTTENPREELLENILKIHRKGSKGVSKQEKISQLQEQLKKIHELLQSLKERKRRDVNSNIVSKKEDLDKTKASSLNKQLSDLEKDIDKEFDYARERELQEKQKKHAQKYQTILNIEKQLKHMQKEISSLEGSRKRREDSYDTNKRLQNDEEFLPTSEFTDDKPTDINNNRQKEYPKEDIETQKTGKILPKQTDQEIKLSPEQRKQIQKLDEQVSKVEQILASVKNRQRRHIKSRNQNKLRKLDCVSKKVNKKEATYECSSKPTETIINITIPTTPYKQGHLLCLPDDKAFKCAVQRKFIKGNKKMFLTVPTETLIHQHITCEHRDKKQDNHNAAVYYLDCSVTKRGKRGVSQIPYPRRDNYREMSKVHGHKNTHNTDIIQDTVDKQNQIGTENIPSQIRISDTQNQIDTANMGPANIPNQITGADKQNQLDNNSNNQINNADAKNQRNGADPQLLRKCAEIQSQKNNTNQIKGSTTTMQDQIVNGTTAGEIISKINGQNQIESNNTETQINGTDEQNQINTADTLNETDNNINIGNEVNDIDRQNQINDTQSQINNTQGQINGIGTQNQTGKTTAKSQINETQIQINGTDLQNQIAKAISNAQGQINNTGKENQIDQVNKTIPKSQINDAKNQINGNSLQNQIDQINNINTKNQINNAQNQTNGTAIQQQINNTDTPINKIKKLNTTQKNKNSTQSGVNEADKAIYNKTEVIPEIVIVDYPKLNETGKQTETDINKQIETDNNKQKTSKDIKQGMTSPEDQTFDIYN